MKTELIFPGVLPGNNGSKGLLRMHWTARNKLRDQFTWLVKVLTKNRHQGKVKLNLTRYYLTQPLDYDNLVSTGKIPVDSIVLARVILDDKESIISEREYKQVKVKTKGEQKTVIVIEDI
jgi:hypothetical protein